MLVSSWRALARPSEEIQLFRVLYDFEAGRDQPISNAKHSWAASTTYGLFYDETLRIISYQWRQAHYGTHGQHDQSEKGRRDWTVAPFVTRKSEFGGTWE